MPLNKPFGLGGSGLDYGFEPTTWDLGALGMSQEDYRRLRAGAPEPIVPRQPVGSTAPGTPEPLSPMTSEELALHNATPQFSDEEQDLFFKSLQDEVGQPTQETAPASTSGITAVKDPVTGKVTFVTKNLLGASGGYDPGSEIGYQGGLNALAGRELKPGAPALPGEGEAVLASMKATAPAPDFQAPRDITQLENWGEYMEGVDEGRLQRELFRAQQGQQMQATEIDPRRREEAGLLELAAKAHLLGSEGEQAKATADWTRTRADILRDPAADAMRRGTAGAEQTLGFRARLQEQARAEIDPALLDQAASYLLLKKLAPTPQAARKMAETQLINTKVQEIIQSDPELQRYFIQQTGSVGGYGGAQ